MRGVVGWVPLADPDATGQALERLRGRGKLVGVRHLISNEPDPRWLVQDSVVESLKLLAAAGLVFDAIPVNPAQFESVLAVAQQLPELKIVIESSRAAADPRAGLGAVGDADCPRRRASQHVDEALDRSRHHHALALVDRRASGAIRDHVLDLFSPNRVMAASNWPVILLGASYQETGTASPSWSGPLRRRARAVLGDTAARMYGL